MRRVIHIPSVYNYGVWNISNIRFKANFKCFKLISTHGRYDHRLGVTQILIECHHRVGLSSRQVHSNTVICLISFNIANWNTLIAMKTQIIIKLIVFINSLIDKFGMSEGKKATLEPIHYGISTIYLYLTLYFIFLLIFFFFLQITVYINVIQRKRQWAPLIVGKCATNYAWPPLIYEFRAASN